MRIRPSYLARLATHEAEDSGLELKSVESHQCSDGIINPTRTLGVDTSLRNTGLAVVERQGSTMKAIWSHTIHVPASRPLSQCLLQIREEIQKSIAEYHPTAIAVEGIFFCKFARTSMLLGHARGVVIATAAENGVPVYEYEPRRAKQAVTGYGNASKLQMQTMMKAVFNLEAPPPEDEGDALALAMCHINTSSSIASATRTPL